MSTWHFRALSIEVSVTAKTELHEHLEAIVGTFEPSSGPPQLSYRLQDRQLWRNAICVRRTRQAVDLLAAFELDLYRSLIEACRDKGLLLHSAALAIDGRALLLVGPSGCGKSTLALWTVTAGATYLTDECALIDAGGQVSGLRRPISFDLDTAPPEIPTDFQRKGYPLRRPDGSLRQPLLLHPTVTATLAEHAEPLGTVVLLQRAPAGAPVQIRRLSAGQALCALFAHAMTADRRTLLLASTLASAYPAFELTSGNISAAGAALRDLHAVATGAVTVPTGQPADSEPTETRAPA